jgi:hypothetical protein
MAQGIGDTEIYVLEKSKVYTRIRAKQMANAGKVREFPYRRKENNKYSVLWLKYAIQKPCIRNLIPSAIVLGVGV